MKLNRLLDNLASRGIAVVANDPDQSIAIGGIAADSRKVQRGDLFVAIAGSRFDGARFIDEAVAKGASVVVAGHDVPIGPLSGAEILRTDVPRLFLAHAASLLFARQPETIVAVTGTAGKTSVASFLRQIWAHEGRMAAMVGTTGVVAPHRQDYGSLTTPDPIVLHRLLDELAGCDVTHLAMEASSHGLEQGRLDAVRLSAAGFTNLGHDHLDYHSSMESYFAAKMRLFCDVLPDGAPAVIFADDVWSQRVEEITEAAGRRVLSVGRKGRFLSLKRIEHHRNRQSVEIHHESRIFEVDLPLAGEFQVYNALVAAGLALATGSRADSVFAGLRHLEGASGRLELIGTTCQGAPVYVDYAHKPEALENVLSSLRPFTSGRVIVVFGCGGDRDRAKRPLMGEIASRLADVVIVTDDNPRSEIPGAIRAEILQAAPDAIEIPDRATAIAEAVAMLSAGDSLIVAGKGHEQGQIVGDYVLPFSDQDELKKALEGILA